MRPLLDRVEAGHRLIESAVVGALDEGVAGALRRAGILRAMEGNVEEISLPDLARALRALYGVQGRGLLPPATYDMGPPTLGWVSDGDGEREVVLVAPAPYALGNVLIRKRPTLALVPTGQHLTPAMRAQHAPGSMVAIEVLEEALGVRDGHLVRASAWAPPALGLEPSGARAQPVAPVAAKAAQFPGLERWNQLRIAYVNERTVRVDVPGRSQRRTYLDLGLAHPRSREPTRTWEMLVAFCEAHGQFQGKRFGSPDATKKLISRLGQELRALFGLTGSPFHPYRRNAGWKTRFDARARVPDLDG